MKQYWIWQHMSTGEVRVTRGDESAPDGEWVSIAGVPFGLSGSRAEEWARWYVQGPPQGTDAAPKPTWRTRAAACVGELSARLARLADRLHEQ